MNQTDYLLTGASGFLGRSILKKLPTDEVKTLSRSAHSDYEVDVSKQVPAFNEQFATVIHASGKAHVIPKTKEQAQQFFEVNLTGTINLTKGLAQRNVLPKELVFISTVAVYGREEGEDIAEDHPLTGDTPYAKSKILAEEFLTTWCAAHNIVLTILRLPLIVAPNPPGNLGAMIRLMKKGMYVGIGSGKVRKSMVLAEDVAQFIPLVKTIGGIYNLTDGHHPAMKELEAAIAKQMGKRPPVRLPDAVVRVMATVGDLLGSKAPINTLKYRKLTASLTFSDARAKAIGWNPRPVIQNLPGL